MVIGRGQRLRKTDLLGRLLSAVLLIAIGGVGGYYFSTTGTVFGLKVPFLFILILLSKFKMKE